MLAIRALSSRLPRQAATRRAAQVFTFSSTSDGDSAAAAPVSTQPIENDVISAIPIAQATSADLLKHFAFTKETQEKLLPEGIHRHMENTFELVGHRHVMLREHTLEIISLMKDWENQKTAERVPGFVLDGERGSGKSFALQQVVQFARESNWLVLYVPHARAWCYEAPYVMRSPVNEAKFDIDVFGVALLEKFLLCHGPQLSAVPLRGNYGDRYYPASLGAKPKSAAEFDPATLTLRDLVENGIKDEDLACTAVVDLRAELALVTEFPVLIAVDEYNMWFAKTVFGFEGKDVLPNDLSVVAALRDVGTDGLPAARRLANGLFIAAVTENYPSRFDFKKQADYRALRRTMRAYSKAELASIVAYYNQVAFLHDKPSESELAYFRLMTKSLPLHVFDRASYA